MNLEEVVHDAMDNSLENEYLDLAKPQNERQMIEEAGNMICLLQECEESEIEDIVPHIQSWWKKQ